MSITSRSLLSALSGKEALGTDSHIFAAIFTVTTFTLRVVQSYLFTPIPNVKHIPLPSPAPLSSPATPTATRPLTPTRCSEFGDPTADVSYILFSLVFVFIAVLASAGSTFILTRSKSTITPNPSSQKQEQEQGPPPNTPPQQDEGSPDNTEDHEDSNGEESEDGAGDPEDGTDDEQDDEQENDDNSARGSGGSPGGEPDDPSGNSNVNDIPPPQFEPDPSDVLALALLYIYIITWIIRHASHTYLVLKTVAKRLVISAISIMFHALNKYFVMKTGAKRLLTSTISIMRHTLHKHFALNIVTERLFTSVISTRTKASEFLEHALQHVDARFFSIENVGLSMALDIVDVGFWNGTREIENAIVSVAPEVMMVEELREVNTKPALIEGLLVPISSHPFQIPSSVPLQVIKPPEPIVQLPPLPLPTFEAMIPSPESFVIQSETSSANTTSELLRVVRAISGWGTVALLVRRVVVEWRRRGRTIAQTEQHEPKVEVETEYEDEDEDYSNTAVGEQSNNDVTSNFLDAYGAEKQNSEKEDIEAHQTSDILDNSFVTAQAIDITIDIIESTEQARPIPPTITVSPSFNVPNTPERATTYPSGTPSFVGVFTSSTLRHNRGEGTESCPSPSPAITILLSAPNTPEPVTVYPSGTPSFADVLTSSALRPTHTQEVDSDSRTGPFFTHFTFPVEDISNVSSCADTTTPSSPFEYSRQDDTNTDNTFMISSFTPGHTLRSLASHEVVLSLSPVLLCKRRRLNEADQITIRLATPSFNGITTSSPAVNHDRRWLVDEFETPIRNTRTYTSASRSIHSMKEGSRGNTIYDESESESEPATDSDNVFNDNYPSFSPAVQCRQEWHFEETEETSSVNRDSFARFVPDTDEEFDLTEDEADSGAEEQVHEGLSEEEMDIDDEDHSNIYDLESEPFELTPRPTPASASIGKNFTSEGDQIIRDQLTPKPTPTSVNNSFISEGNQTILDPEVIAQGAAQMLRLLQEEMEREKVAKKEVAKEEKRAGKMKMRESSAVREAVDGTRRKYVGPLEALKRGAAEEILETSGGFVQKVAVSSSLPKHKTHEVDWQFSREKMIQEVARMRALVMTAYASEDYDDEEIDRLTLLHLGIGDMEGNR